MTWSPLSDVSGRQRPMNQKCVAGDDGPLFDTIAGVTGASVVVDTSKSPARLTRLAKAGYDVRAIVLTRHVGAASRSAARKNGRWPLRALECAGTVIASRTAALGIPHLAVTYEELATDPATVVRRSTELLGLEYDPAQLRFRSHEHHDLFGNRMRFGGDETIALDERWRSESSAVQRVMLEALDRMTRIPVEKLARPRRSAV